MMRIALIAAGFALVAYAPAEARQDTDPGRLLAGRTAGKPVTCIQQTMIDDTQTFDSGEIYYRMRGGPDYLNSPHCPGLRSDIGMVTRTPTTSLCRGDIVDLVDFTSGMHYGGCPLADFIPYARIPKAKR